MIEVVLFFQRFVAITQQNSHRKYVIYFALEWPGIWKMNLTADGFACL